MDLPLEDQPQSHKKTLKPRKRKKGMCLEDRPVLEPNAAGIDVGSRENVRTETLKAFTEDEYRKIVSDLS
jgi:hypothetical protein